MCLIPPSRIPQPGPWMALDGLGPWFNAAKLTKKWKHSRQVGAKAAIGTSEAETFENSAAGLSSFDLQNEICSCAYPAFSEMFQEPLQSQDWDQERRNKMLSYMFQSQTPEGVGCVGCFLPDALQSLCLKHLKTAGLRRMVEEVEQNIILAEVELDARHGTSLMSRLS